MHLRNAIKTTHYKYDMQNANAQLFLHLACLTIKVMQEAMVSYVLCPLHPNI